MVTEIRNATLVGVGAALVFLVAVMAMTYPASQRESHTLAPPAVESKVGGVPILCHHYIRAKTTPFGFVKILGALFLNLPLLGNMDVWTQTTSSFEKQMAYLAENGYQSVGLDELVAWQRGYGELPPKPFAITFDDGDRSALELAHPILERYGFKATLFVVTSKVGKQWDRVDCLTWDELRDLQEAGVFSIQSHSHDLHRKVKTSQGMIPVFVAAGSGLYVPPGGSSWREMVSDDLETSRALIKEHLGVDARFLAWPYGFASAVLDSVAVSAGFEATCTLEEGINVPQPIATTAPYRDRLELKRFTILARTTMKDFRLIIREDSSVEDTVAGTNERGGFFGLLDDSELYGP